MPPALGNTQYQQRFYSETCVEDLVLAAKHIHAALKLQTELIELLNAGGFQLRKWTLNHQALLNALPHELIETIDSTRLEKKGCIETLGLI